MTEGRAALLGVVVGGLFGVIGTLGGTLATSYFTQEQAEDVEAKRALGAARVIADNLRRAEARMASSLDDCTYRGYDVPQSLPHEDLVLLAWRVDPQQWDVVGQATESIRLQLERSHESRVAGHEFEQYDVTQIRYVIDKIDTARRALQDLSGLGPSTEEDIAHEKALGRALRCEGLE